MTLGKERAKVVADADGKWRITLKAQPVSKAPLVVEVKGKNRLAVKDVLVGDVSRGALAKQNGKKILEVVQAEADDAHRGDRRRAGGPGPETPRRESPPEHRREHRQGRPEEG